MNSPLHLEHKFWESSKSVEEIAKAIQASSITHKFGVLSTFNLKSKLDEKGIKLDNDCIVIEVCNPSQAARILKQNMAISLALPCRISVYSEQGKTRIGFTTPSTILPQYMDNKTPIASELVSTANEVDRSLIDIVEDALKSIQNV